MRILLIGNFLSSTGTMPVMERVSAYLKEEYGYHFILASAHRKPLPRLLSMIRQALLARYSIIHIDVFSGNSFWFALITAFIGKWRGKRVILSLRGGALIEFACRNSSRVKKLLLLADTILTPSLFLKEHFLKQHFNVHYLPNPVRTDHFPFKEHKVPEASPRLLWVRAFTAIYNPELPVLVLKEVSRIFPAATLTMVGPDKGLMRNVKELIGSLSLENKVTITGPVPNEQLAPFYHTHSVYLNTTSYESFGVSVLEAAACGIPIISNKVGEIPFLWRDGHEVLMVEDNSIAQYVEKIQWLMNNKEAYLSLQENARRKADTFHWNNIKESWLKVFSDSGKML